MSLFSPPAGGGDIVKPEALNGHLLIVRPVDFKPDFPTSFGATDAISADLVDLSEAGPDGQPRVYNGALFFNKMLVSGLKSEIGKMVLAVMIQGIAKPGQSPPWQLQDATKDPASVAAATAYLTSHPEFQGMAPPSPIRPVTPTPPVSTPTPYVPPIAGAANPTARVGAPTAVAPVLPSSVPGMSFTQVPLEVPLPAPAAAPAPALASVGAAAPAAGLPEGITPETLALIAKMQASGQIPGANSH
jgi:hypothetical protein